MNQKSKGFTLIELMVVASITGILVLIGGISVIKALPGYQLQKAARDMVGNLRTARSMAIKFNRQVSVVFYVDKKQYSIDGSSPLDGKVLPKFAATAETMTSHYGSGVTFGFPDRSDCVHFTKGGADAGYTITFNTTGLTGGVVGYVYIQNRNSIKSKEGYRIGVSGLGANIKMDQCGSKDSSGVTITCLE